MASPKSTNAYDCIGTKAAATKPRVATESALSNSQWYAPCNGPFSLSSMSALEAVPFHRLLDVCLGKTSLWDGRIDPIKSLVDI